jgi:hypothetical protein
MNTVKHGRSLARNVLSMVGLLDAARVVAREVHTQRQNLLSADRLAPIYRSEYHESVGYGSLSAQESPWESDAVIKAAHAQAIIAILPGLRRVLIGGCSSGMAVLAFRNVGVDAWGFDISPDLERIVLPEVRPYIRSGSMTDIPFDERDKFDCLVTTDVLEHVQLKNMNTMCQEIARIATRWMVHLINHTSIQPDHMTLRPLSWWVGRFQAIQYSLRRDLKVGIASNPRIYGLNGDPAHAFTFWERQ